MKLTKDELKIIINYLEFGNHTTYLDNEDRIGLLNRLRTELSVNELRKTPIFKNTTNGSV